MTHRLPKTVQHQRRQPHGPVVATTAVVLVETIEGVGVAAVILGAADATKPAVHSSDI